MKSYVILRGVIVVASIALIVVLIRESGLASGADALTLWVDETVRGHGVLGALVFIAAGVLFTGAGLSRQVFAFVAGYAFGVTLGAGLALIAEIGGVMAAFCYARYLGRDVIAARLPKRIRRFDEFLQVNPFLTTLAAKLFPLSSNLVVNLAGGISSVPAVPFFAASAVGHFPQTLVFALIGSGLATGIYLKGALAVVLFVASAVIGYALYRRFRGAMVLDPPVADILEQPAGSTADYGQRSS